MDKISANGITLAYEWNGAGQPLVLISGVGYGAWFWKWVVPGLASHFQVLTFDNRGAGESDQPEGPYTVSMLAADSAGLLDALGIETACVLGHSLGGFVAQELAITRPDLVGRLVLASTNHGGPEAVPITPEALEVMLNREGEPLELVRRGIAIASAPGFTERQPRVVQALIDYRFTNPVPPAQYQAQVMAGAGMAGLTAEQVTQRLATIQAPTLILFGEHDMVVPPANAPLMAGKLRSAQVRLIPNTGHIFPIEDPEATVQAVVDFCQETG